MQSRANLTGNFFILRLLLHLYITMSTIKSNRARVVITSFTYFFASIKVYIDSYEVYSKLTTDEMNSMMLVYFCLTIATIFTLAIVFKFQQIEVKEAAKDYVVSQKYSKVLDTIQEAIFVLKPDKLEFVNKVGLDLVNQI